MIPSETNPLNPLHSPIKYPSWERVSVLVWPLFTVELATLGGRIRIRSDGKWPRIWWTCLSHSLWMEISGSQNRGTVPYCWPYFWGISLTYRPYIGLVYGSHLQFRFLKLPLILSRGWSFTSADPFNTIYLRRDVSSSALGNDMASNLINYLIQNPVISRFSDAPWCTHRIWLAWTVSKDVESGLVHIVPTEKHPASHVTRDPIVKFFTLLVHQMAPRQSSWF